MCQSQPACQDSGTRCAPHLRPRCDKGGTSAKCPDQADAGTLGVEDDGQS